MRSTRPQRDGLVRCAVLAVSAACAAVLAVHSRHTRLRPAALLSQRQLPQICRQAKAAMGSLRQQDSMCTQLCGGAAVSDQGLAECSQCGVTNVNINMPGSQPYYPGYYSYAGYYPSGYYPCYESSYDPLEWYDYYFKYDPALAPYYEPYTPPAEEAACDEEAPCEEPAPAEEEEPTEEKASEEDEAPVQEEPEETAAVETPEVCPVCSLTRTHWHAAATTYDTGRAKEISRREIGMLPPPACMPAAARKPMAYGTFSQGIL